MAWTVESGIPIPPKRSGGKKTPAEKTEKTGLSEALKSLAVGQSIHVTSLTRGQVTGVSTTVTRSWGYKFATRATDAGIRVWRVE